MAKPFFVNGSHAPWTTQLWNTLVGIHSNPEVWIRARRASSGLILDSVGCYMFPNWRPSLGYWF